MLFTKFHNIDLGSPQSIISNSVKLAQNTDIHYIKISIYIYYKIYEIQGVERSILKGRSRV